jgi:hypothetical protein
VRAQGDSSRLTPNALQRRKDEQLSSQPFSLRDQDERFVETAAGDLETAMKDYDLTAEEKDALRSGDPRKLRQLGVHGMISLYIKRLEPAFRDNIYWSQK